MRCVVYNRLSVSNNGVSLTRQEYFCRKYALDNDLVVSEVYNEVGSAYKQKPAVLNSLVNRCGMCIIVYNVSRFSRSVELGLEMANAALKNGNKIHFVEEGFCASKKNIEQLKLLFLKAELESDILSQRIKLSKEYLRDNGMYQGGYVPFGYDVDDENMMVKNESELSVATFIRECRKSKVSSKRLNRMMRELSDDDLPIVLYRWGVEARQIETISYENIANLLNSYNIKKRGSPWNARTVKSVAKGSATILSKAKGSATILSKPNPEKYLRKIRKIEQKSTERRSKRLCKN